jgi:hypothetical protein
MTNQVRKSFAGSVVAGAVVLCGVGSSAVSGQEQSTPFPVASVFFELNNSAGDLGIHGEIDGGPWTTLEIEGPGGRKLLSLVSKSRLRTQGMTQLAFESAEPPFSELAPEDFFRRFPEGEYEIEGRRQDGSTLESTVRLSHVMAAPPGNITVNNLPAAESCDALPLPVVQSPVLVRWDPVTQSHPDLGKAGLVEIARYQFFAELRGGKLSIDLPPTTTEWLVPFQNSDRGQTFKFEIIARTSTGNNTAVESCFVLQ